MDLSCVRCYPGLTCEGPLLHADRGATINYAMLYTRPIVYLTMSLARRYNSDPGVDHWKTVKIILSGIRKCFSVMEVTKSSS